MSTTSPQAAAAGTASMTQASLAQQLSGVALPAIQQTISQILGQTGGGFDAVNPLVQKEFTDIRASTNADYDAAMKSSGGLIRQRALQSGMPFSSNQLQDATQQAILTLNQDRSLAMKNLDYAQAQASLGQYDQLMNLLGSASGAALNLGQGASGNQMRAIGGMSNSSPFGGALSGAMAGASLGGTIGGGYGALAGGVIGGVGGYLGSGG